MDDWKTLILALTFISGLAQWIVTFRFRRQDQTWVETMKGEIRRDVEENLKTHESRLRMQADLRLRMHDRSWGLLRDFVAAAWRAHDKLADVLLNASIGRLSGINEARAALGELATLTTTLPPESQNMQPAIELFRKTLAGCITLLNEKTRPDLNVSGAARQAELVVGVEALGSVATGALRDITEKALAWNKTLWDESQTVPSPR